MKRSHEERDGRIAVGILGFGSLGKYLYTAITTEERLKATMYVQYVWNRSPTALDELPEELRLADLDSVVAQGADVVVEVSHPSISTRLGAAVLRSGCDFFIGSPTAMADADTEAALRAAASGKGKGALYIPTGAMWGAGDIQALANRGGLYALTITMKKHPASFRLPHAETDAKRAAACDSEGEHVLYEGSVRGLCPIAPNNVNTMACAAMAAHTLGFDGTVGRLVADTALKTHEVEVLALGPPNTTTGAQLRIHVVRSSPAPPGAVTSRATYGSFLESLIKAHGRGPGVHFV